MKLPLQSPVQVELFSVLNRTKSFSAELSDLRGYQIFQRLYDDACDVGFNIENRKTGNVITVVFSSTETNEDGEVICHTFVPTSDSIRRFPDLEEYQIFIFND
jgi:hypothetical protein